jgi:type II secretory pathway pseudopilin PulG
MDALLAIAITVAIIAVAIVVAGLTLRSARRREQEAQRRAAEGLLPGGEESARRAKGKSAWMRITGF